MTERIQKLEQELGRSEPMRAPRDDADKFTLVVGGFGTVPKEVALETVKVALDEVAGFVEAYATSDVPSVVFA
eukprot:9656171-Heterocapsa_arctica.AAC.1